MRFSIRDLALVTVIVALVLGWWIDHRGQAERREKAEAGLQMLCDYVTDEGYKLGWDTEKNSLTVSRPSERSLPNSQTPAPNPPKP
jgi:hypothetical protein